MPGRIPVDTVDGKLVNPQDIQNALRAMLEREAKLEKMAALELSLDKNRKYRAAEYEKQDAKFDAELSKFTDTVRRLKEEFLRGYNNDWISSTYAIMALAESIALVLGAYDPVGRLVGLVDESLGLSELVNRQLDKLTYTKPPEKALPELRFHAKMDAKGKIDLSSLKDMCRSDGKPMFPDELASDPRIGKVQKALERQLRAGLTVWLEGQGYKPEQVAQPDGSMQDTGAFLDVRTNEKLTKTEFNKLRDNEEHPEQSFQAFLKAEFGPEFKHESAPRMRR